MKLILGVFLVALAVASGMRFASLCLALLTNQRARCGTNWLIFSTMQSNKRKSIGRAVTLASLRLIFLVNLLSLTLL